MDKLSTQPNNTLSLNVGGVSVNYDLGSSADTVANQAYAFVNNSFNADSALLNSATIGANNLVTQIANPAIALATNQQNFNTTTLPTLLSNLQTGNLSFGNADIAATQQIANASLSNSASIAKSSDGCFITTVVVDCLGFDDKCELMITLRKLRDWVVSKPYGCELFDKYRSFFDIFKPFFDDCQNKKDFCKIIYNLYLLPCAFFVEQGYCDSAFNVYRDLIHVLYNTMQYSGKK